MCVLLYSIYRQHYVCVLSFIFSLLLSANSFPMRLLFHSQQQVSCLTQDSLLPAGSSRCHGNGPPTVAGARQVPEENFRFGSPSNAAAILFKKIKIKK